MRIRSLDYEEILKALGKGFGTGTGTSTSIYYFFFNSRLGLINLF